MDVLSETYKEKVYAGVLGKIIGVYLGGPVESWLYTDIMARFGEVKSYLNHQLGKPIVLTDDDIFGTFTFIRALSDRDDISYSKDESRPVLPQALPTSLEIAQTWLNYLVESRSPLWWGGLFHSTEHTAFINLKAGIMPPLSGSIKTNGSILANQIGAQIFIDGWAMLAPGDPSLAVEIAERAAKVSHDGDAIQAARFIAAMEAQAFIETDIDHLLDAGLSYVKPGSLIVRLADDLRRWHADDGNWHLTRERIEKEYGYKKYKGGCHIIPNHALVLMSLLYGQGDFSRSLSICVTSGWDTDCNAANLGCLLGIRNGLSAFDGEVDWRTPVADRLFVPAADGAECISDAVIQSYHVINMARRLRGHESLRPKNGARFHFELPGSLQGFQIEQANDVSQQIKIHNVPGHSQNGQRSLAISWTDLKLDLCARIATATFILPPDLDMPGYRLPSAAPTLYPGQVVNAAWTAGEINHSTLQTRLYTQYYDSDDQPARLYSEAFPLKPGETAQSSWRVPDTGGGTIFEIGIEINSPSGMAGRGCIYLDYLGWDGAPTVTFTRPTSTRQPNTHPVIWKRAWMDAMDQFETWWRQSFRVIQNRGRGLLITGNRQWQDYQVSASITPVKFTSGGIAIRVQGLHRYYAMLLVEPNRLQLVKMFNQEQVLGEIPFRWKGWQPYELNLLAEGNRLEGRVDGKLMLAVEDNDHPLTCGGIALVVERGHMATHAIHVKPVRAG